MQDSKHYHEMCDSSLPRSASISETNLLATPSIYPKGRHNLLVSQKHRSRIGNRPRPMSSSFGRLGMQLQQQHIDSHRVMGGNNTKAFFFPSDLHYLVFSTPAIVYTALGSC